MFWFKNKKKWDISAPIIVVLFLFIFLSLAFFASVYILHKKNKYLAYNLNIAINNVHELQKQYFSKETIQRANKAVVKIFHAESLDKNNLSLDFLDNPFFLIPLENNSKTSFTGFIFDSEKNLIMTVKHAVSKNMPHTIELFDGTKLEAKVIFEDNENDLAILKVVDDNVDLTALTIFKQSAELGDKVISFGFSESNHSPSFYPTYITKTGINLSEEKNELKDLYQINTKIKQGDSGGPVVTSDGLVVGMNVAISNENNVSFILPTKKINEGLKRFIEMTSL